MTATGELAPPQTQNGVILRAIDVVKTYGGVHALKGVNFEARKGKVTVLFGENGAGKSTLMKILSGVEQPTSGRLELDGKPLALASINDGRAAGIGMIHQELNLCANLSVRDNLVVAASCGAPLGRLTEVAYTLFPRLAERRNQLAGTLSGGEKQMLALARGLGTDPSVLLIDELSMGLAPMVVGELYEAVAHVAETGVSVLVVEQFASIGLRYADTAFVMAHGNVTYSGSSAGAMDAVQTAYLGHG